MSWIERVIRGKVITITTVQDDCNKVLKLITTFVHKNVISSDRICLLLSESECLFTCSTLGSDYMTTSGGGRKIFCRILKI